ncbi:hypothetical protein SAMN05720766_11836 [Fibrobacter sp. UWH9]|uniref:hypothetical protein n=1 Tax=Fibrobacter sp. UWH9 TaxID=1896213 RepID=UPI000922F197|nr:hypothetical protein [Fibrobacter sp. UWH9]SHH66851.1 hypothetical protein SAMN05720766_11836 [Fibrobacter sp. UWH9]
MSIKNIFTLGLKLAAIAGTTCLLFACGDDSSSNSEPEEFGYVPSSSSISTRADIDYGDTIVLNKKLDLNIELIKDTADAKDSSEIYIDSLATKVPLYIGELTRGSRIRVKASVANIASEKIRIRSEYGEALKALTAIPRNDAHRDSIYDNYMVPSLGTKPDSTYRDSNQFVVFTPNHYYLEIEGEFTNESTARLFVQIDTSYYKYTGENDSVSMEMSDTLRGIILMGDDAPENITIDFAASEGHSLNLTTEGTNLNKCELFENDSLLSEAVSEIDTMMIPNDTTSWSLKITPETFSSVWSGPFAFFTTTTRSRELEKGEYFANPDSIKYPGETFQTDRPKDLPEAEIYRYNLRQEQFVWIGNYEKGDSLMVKHWIANYSEDNFNSPSTCEILNKDKKVVASISCTYGGELKVPAKGPYYLHYLRLNSYALSGVSDSLKYVLQLFVMVQQPGLLKSMNFYDLEKDEPMTLIKKSAGSVLRFKDINNFNFEAKSSSQWKEIGSDVSWFVPCESLNYINRDNLYRCSDDDDEQEISSDYLMIQESGIGETAKIIAQSKADPSMRDTLKISIIKAAD